MAVANLHNEGVNIDTGKESIVIRQDLGDIQGGRTLDVTGYAPSVIEAGHVMIKETATGVYKPLRGDMVRRARAYLAAIPRPEIGAGSDEATLYAACRLVRGFELTDQEAIELIEQWAGHRPGWDREWLARKVENARKSGEEPVGGLR